MLRWIFSFLRDRITKVRILGHIQGNCDQLWCSPRKPYQPSSLPKLPKLLPNTRRSLFADGFMIYTESSITRSDLIQSNHETSRDNLTLLNSNHRIILSCTKSVRVLFERK